MANTIQIPKFDGAVPVSEEALKAPDAPMRDTPQVGSVMPVATPSEAQFLDSVREVNLKKQPQPTKPEEAKPEVKPEVKQDVTPPVFKKAAEAQEEKVEEKEEDREEDFEDFTDPLETPPSTEKPSKAKNMKELKAHLRTSRSREAQLRTRTEELEAEVARLSGFQEKMDEHEQLKERVAQLEPFEKIFDIHSNPEFHAKYIEGAENVTTQAKQIATQYGIQDEAVIDQAVKIRNRKDLNQFLKQSGLDEYGISDIRPYIFHLQGLEDERVQLEKSPEEAREVLSKMYREGEERRTQALSKTIHDRSTNAWNQITGYYATGESAVDAFKEKPGDPEHTERRTNVLQRASDEYVKMMGAFTGLGLRDLPAAIAHTLAARFQLSEWTGEFIAENKSLKQQLAELKAQLKDNSTYTRPSFNGSTNSSAPAELPKGTGVAEHVFNKAREQVASR